MKRSQEHDLRRKCNRIDAYCGIKDYLYNDGPNRGLRAFDVNNGRNLELTFLADRGLDIPYLRYKGKNVGLINKVGIRSPYLYVEDGNAGFLKQFNGGMLTTCGITYAGGSGVDNGKALGLHGPFSNLPAQQVCAEVEDEGDDRVLRISGNVQQSEVFAENMIMKREYVVETERDVVRICDTVTNCGYETQPVMLIYHINFGYPMLDAGARAYFSAGKVEPRTAFAEQGMDKYDLMEEPGDGRDEQCYYHTQQPENGEAFAMIHNEALGMAGIVHFDPKVFPLMCEWKCMRSGEYALGLEPTTSGVVNRSEVREKGDLTYLEAGESREYNISIELTDDIKRIEHYKALAHKA